MPLSSESATLPDDQVELAEFLVRLGSISMTLPVEAEILGDPEMLRAGIVKFAKNENGPVPALSSPGPYTCLAGLAYALALYGEAVALADRAIAVGSDGLSPGTSYARLVKASALISSGNHKKAIGVLDDALKRDPRLAAAHLMKSRSLMAREMYQRAIESYKEAYLAEAAPEALVEAGGCCLALGQAEKADRLFFEARERFPAQRDRISAAGGRLAAEARAHRSQPLLKGLLRVFADEPEVWAQMARHYAETGEPDRAVRCFERAIGLGGPPTLRLELEEAKVGVRERLRCPACGGTGDCRGCSDGKCDRCHGASKCGECDGKGACPECEGTEDCSDCEGKGKSGLMKRCERCDGTGDCPECEAGECGSCGKTGECPGCAGAGECVECSGAAKCRICKGSGVVRAPG